MPSQWGIGLELIQAYVRGTSVCSEGDIAAFPHLKSKGVIKKEEDGTGDKLQAFFDWRLKVGRNIPDTRKDYVSYLKKPLDRKKKWRVMLINFTTSS